MKIWLLSSEHPLQPASGMGRYVARWADILARAGEEVTVLAPAESAAWVEQPAGWHLFTFVPSGQLGHVASPDLLPDEQLSFPYNCLDATTALSWQMSQEMAVLAEGRGAPEIVESQECLGLPYYFLQRKLLQREYPVRAPLSLVLHAPSYLRRPANHEPIGLFPHYWHGQLEKNCIIAAEQRIVPSQFLEEQVAASLPEHRLEFLRIPLPCEIPECTWPERIPGRVVFIGRLEICKGILELVQACQAMWREGEDFTLHVIGGDAPYPARGTTVGLWLRHKYSTWLSSGKLILHGALPYEEAWRFAQTAFLQVIPSTWENYPYTCIEAMAARRLVLASTSGGQAEMLGGTEDCGLLFDWRNPEQFPQQLRRALRFDEEKARSMGEAARRRIAGLCRPQTVLTRRLDAYAALRKGPLRRVFPFLQPSRSVPYAVAPKTPGQEPPPPETARFISAVIPFYNMGQYVEETLDSLSASTLPPREIILLDDGSDDPSSLRILETLPPRYPGLRIVRQPNRGLAAARYAGALAARGTWLLFCDADDAIEPTFLEKACHVLETYDNVHLVTSWERYFGESRDLWPNWNLELPYLLAHNLCPSRALVRADSWRKAVVLRERELPYNFEDYEMWLAMRWAGFGGVSLPEILLRYRIRPQSLWQNATRHQFLYLYEQLTRLYPEAYRQFGAELFYLQNANGPAESWNRPAGNPPIEDQQNSLQQRLTELQKELEMLRFTIQTHKKALQATLKTTSQDRPIAD